MGADTTTAVMGAGAVGALAASFSDTMWFSADRRRGVCILLVSSLSYCGRMKWNEEADEPHGNRWLVFGAFMIGVSIGVHLLSLLVIPVAVIVYYFKKFKHTKLGFIIAFMIGFILLGMVRDSALYRLPLDQWCRGIFLREWHRITVQYRLYFLLGVAVCCIYIPDLYAHKSGMPICSYLWSVCFLVIFIGFSSYVMVPIRAAANPPINMNNPKDAFSLFIVSEP